MSAPRCPIYRFPLNPLSPSDRIDVSTPPVREGSSLVVSQAQGQYRNPLPHAKRKKKSNAPGLACLDHPSQARGSSPLFVKKPLSPFSSPAQGPPPTPSLRPVPRC